jgi:hypothetical protein
MRERSAGRDLVGKLEREIYHLENLSADRRVLRWVLNRKRGQRLDESGIR